MEPIQINLDFLMFGRCFVALLWGILLAVFLQHNRLGSFLANQRTWLTVVAGVGVDLLIAYRAEYFTVVAVIAISSVGIIGRSLWNEQQYEPDPGRYTIKWQMEDVIDYLGDIIKSLERTLEGGELKLVSQALGKAHQAQRVMTVARYGQPETKNGRSR